MISTYYSHFIKLNIYLVIIYNLYQKALKWTVNNLMNHVGKIEEIIIDTINKPQPKQINKPLINTLKIKKKIKIILRHIFK